MSQRLLGHQLIFIGQAVSRVFRQEAVDAFGKFGNCVNFIFKSY